MCITEEQRMVQGFGLTRGAVSTIVQDYLRDHPERGSVFSSSGPGFDWWQCFLGGQTLQLESLNTSVSNEQRPPHRRIWMNGMTR